MRQWEIWKGRPDGVSRDHCFVLVSNQERLSSERRLTCNGLICFTLRGSPLTTEVRLNSADGFEHETVCDCDVMYLLAKSNLHSRIGMVSFERQQQIKALLRLVFRL